MPKYIFAYHHGPEDPTTAEESAALMQRWQDWLASMGGSCVDMGNPVGLSKTVSADGVADNGGVNPLAGFSFVNAADAAAACEMAKGCPLVVDGTGTVEVAPVVDM